MYWNTAGLSKRWKKFSFTEDGMSVSLNHFLPLQLSLIQELLMNSLTGPEQQENEPE